MRSDRDIISTLEMRKGIKRYLDYEDFRAMVNSLRRSQGFYGRIYEQLLELEQEGNEEYLEDLKKQIDNLKATRELDFIYWLEQ